MLMLKGLPLRHLLAPTVWLIGLVPLCGYLGAAFTNALGANPVEALIRALGTWSLNLLLLTLAVTPLRRIAQWHWLAPARRHLGLLAFAYGALHFVAYAWLDQGLDAVAVLRDVVKRPFITVGALAVLGMLPLALTSTNTMVKRLGGARWRALHRLAYAVAMLGVLHYVWLVKRDVSQPAMYAAVLAALLGYRVWVARRPNRP